MGEPESTATPAEAGSFMQEAILRAIDNSRSAIMLASLFGAASVAAYGLSALFSSRLDHIDAALTLPLALMFLYATRPIRRWPTERLLPFMRSMVVVSSFGFFALLCNNLFGINAWRLMNGELPLLLVILPSQLVFIRTYMPDDTADSQVALLLGGSILLGIGYAVVEPAALRNAAWYWLMASFALVGPLCLAMVHLQSRLHSERLRALHRAAAVVQEENAWLLRAQKRDSLSQGLNEAAVLEALRGSVIAQDHTHIMLLDLEDYDQLRLTQGADVMRSLIDQISQELAGALGPGTQWGRWHGRQFVVWNPQMPKELFASCAGLLEQVLKEADFGLPTPLSVRIGLSSTTRHSPDLAGEATRDLIEDAWHAAWPERTGRFVDA